MDKITLATRVIGPTDAREILEELKYEGQRPARWHWIDFLAREMDRGAFHQGTTIQYCVLNGKGDTYLVDGYSRLNAVVKSGKPQLFVEVYTKADSMEEVTGIYMKLDQGLRRSLPDTFLATGLGKRLEMDRTNLKQLGGAVRLIDSGLSSRAKRIPLDIHSKLMEEWAPEYDEFYSAITGVHMPEHVRRRFTNVSVMGVALATYRYQPKMAEEFWRGAALDDGLAASDPRKALLKFLDSYASGRTSDNRQYMPSIEFMGYVARCWNAHFEGEKLSRIRRTVKVKPVEVLGTPYTVGGPRNV